MNPNTDTPNWRPIGNSLDYFISDDGQVKQICENGEGRILHSTPDSSGYLHVCIESTSMLVHRLVAKAFIPNPHNYTDVHHRNGNRADNRAENLMWCSHKRHMGKHNGIPIVHLNEDYVLIGSYSSAAEAHRRTGVPASTIRECCRRENHMTRCGYIWMNREDYNQLVEQDTVIVVNPIIPQKGGEKIMEKSIYIDGYCHKVHGREILRIPDDNAPLVHYHVYAQIDEEGKYYITPSGVVCSNYPGYVIAPKVDNEGYYFVYVHGQRRRIKDIIEEVFDPVPDNPPETYRVV